MVAVEDGKATVELDHKGRCVGCGLCSSAAAGKMHLVLEAIENLEPGQTVIVAIDRSVSLRSVFLLSGLPLIGLVVGAAVGHLWPVFGLAPDASSVLLSLVFLAAAFLIAVLYDRKVAAKTMREPTILRIESDQKPAE